MPKISAYKTAAPKIAAHGLTIIGSRVRAHHSAYAERLRATCLGLETGAFGDTLRARSGEYALFEFHGRLTHMTILAYDLGCDVSEDGTPPRHRGFLALDLRLSGHLEEALRAAADLIGRAKSGDHPDLDAADLALLEAARARDAVHERRAVVAAFTGSEIRL